MELENHCAPTDMPKKRTSFFFLPRLKEGEDPDRPPRHIRINYKVLEGLFHLPLKDAARETGLCPTTFKKACRSCGMQNWPYRRGRRETANRTLHRAFTASPVWHDGMWDTSSSGTVISSAAPEGLPQLASMALDTRSCGEARYPGPASTHKTFAPLATLSYSDSLSWGSICIRLPSGPSEGQPTTGPYGGKQGGATPLKTFPPRERSCVEAVMECLELGCPIAEADVAAMLSDDD